MANAMKNKDIQKKIIEKKRRLSKYTFFVDEMKKHTGERNRKRRSLVKRKKRSRILLNETNFIQDIKRNQNGNSLTSIELNFREVAKIILLRQKKCKQALKK